MKDSYLFYNIAQKTKAYVEEHPGVKLLRMGIVHLASGEENGYLPGPSEEIKADLMKIVNSGCGNTGIYKITEY